jgi:hypothetical protein
MSNPAKFALSYLLIDVYLTGHFPQLFIRYNPGPPDLHEDLVELKLASKIVMHFLFPCMSVRLPDHRQVPPAIRLN